MEVSQNGKLFQQDFVFYLRSQLNTADRLFSQFKKIHSCIRAIIIINKVEDSFFKMWEPFIVDIFIFCFLQCLASGNTTCLFLSRRREMAWSCVFIFPSVILKQLLIHLVIIPQRSTSWEIKHKICQHSMCLVTVTRVWERNLGRKNNYLICPHGDERVCRIE